MDEGLVVWEYWKPPVLRTAMYGMCKRQFRPLWVVLGDRCGYRLCGDRRLRIIFVIFFIVAVVNACKIPGPLGKIGYRCCGVSLGEV